MFRNQVRIVVMCCALCAAWCLPVMTAHAQAASLRGKVVVDGSSTVFPITEAAAHAFKTDYPNVDVVVGVSGTGGGFKRFVKGEIDISDASRPIKKEEFDAARQNQVRFIELPVGIDGLSIVVNHDNTWVDKLTVEQLQDLFSEDGKTRKWNDLNPAWPAEPIKLYSPGTDSGTFDYFREVIMGKRSFRSDLSTSEDDNVLVTGINGDKYALGYFGAAYYYENREKVKAVPVVNPTTGEAVLPEPAHVLDNSYAPLSRPLFIYVNLNALRRPETRKFVAFYLERCGELSQKVGYVALPDEIVERAKDFLAKQRAGTVWLQPDGVQRHGALIDIYRPENLVDTL